MSMLHSRGRGVQVGDLVTISKPDTNNVLLLKRVLGMPGDFVVVDPMSAGFLPPSARSESESTALRSMKRDADGWMGGVGEGETQMIQIPEGHCWLAGDNIPHSYDSKVFGPVPLGMVRSKVVFRFKIGKKWGWIKNPVTKVEDGSRM